MPDSLAYILIAQAVLNSIFAYRWFQSWQDITALQWRCKVLEERVSAHIDEKAHA